MDQITLEYPQVSDGTSVRFQNQLLTKGMVILRDKIRFYEGESQVECSRLAVVWLMFWDSGVADAGREQYLSG